jgi:mRNA deadenylase 3'-5' endonuclease subunit Ccr4
MECKEFVWVGSLMMVLRELSKYKSDLVGVQEVR